MTFTVYCSKGQNTDKDRSRKSQRTATSRSMHSVTAFLETQQYLTDLTVMFRLSHQDTT
jgi:hypothetical protein